VGIELVCARMARLTRKNAVRVASKIKVSGKFKWYLEKKLF